MAVGRHLADKSAFEQQRHSEIADGVLTALAVEGVSPRPTAYVGNRLLVREQAGTAEVLARMQGYAEADGWRLEEPRPLVPDGVKLRSAITSVVEVTVIPGRAAPHPDAWVILQRARNDFRRRCRAFIHQNDDRLALAEVAAARINLLPGTQWAVDDQRRRWCWRCQDRLWRQLGGCWRNSGGWRLGRRFRGG